MYYFLGKEAALSSLGLKYFPKSTERIKKNLGEFLTKKMEKRMGPELAELQQRADSHEVLLKMLEQEAKDIVKRMGLGK